MVSRDEHRFVRSLWRAFRGTAREPNGSRAGADAGAETLFLFGAGWHGGRARLGRAGAARSAAGDRRRLGRRRRRRRSEEASADQPCLRLPAACRGDADFIDWVATYTLSPPGLVARMALRAPNAFEPEPMVEGLKLVGGEPERMTPARARVLATASDGFSRHAAALRMRRVSRRVS